MGFAVRVFRDIRIQSEIGRCEPHCKRAAHELQQTASWFEVNIHVRGTDFLMK